MGRAIDMEKRLDDLEYRVNEILLILDEFRQSNTVKENIDIHETTKEKKSNNEGSGKRAVKSDSRKSKKSDSDNDNSKSSK